MSIFFRLSLRTACALLLCSVLVGCLGSREAEEVPPDERFGHRYSNEGPDGRATLTLSPPDSNASYFYYPAVFDTVVVRPAPFSPDSPAGSQEVDVEVLVKGSFPDACSELHEVMQERAGNILTATLMMRKPEGSICASVSRPYRFYTMLDGQYSVGNYTLKLNNKVVPFEIRAPREETR
jgi:hypothetical protein